ncbi:MAG: cytochrome C [Burkholderiales bacterium RIFCSPHIGHO2_12_FULL_69_20]|nr:MAG: cytochrome C [Burkholderiales bacterium RIFCSPHIGHO2_12_FULL_69_20]
MSSCRKSGWVAAALWLAAGAASAQATQAALTGLGRVATPKEIAAWDIDVRPDFKGLPKGSGTVAQGQDIWETQCASCHGIFGESNEVFTPLVGGTTADDVKTGRVARLLDPTFPGRTTMMKVATVSTLWDYIHRAMPWNQPKSLKPDEVYAVTAYLLNMADVLPESFVLSDQTMAQAQARMPNRNGMNTAHALWPGKGLTSAKAPDVKAVACMSNCAVEPRVASLLPDFARNNHGNLAEQNRMVGAQHGVDTTRAPGAAPAKAAPATTPTASAKPAAGGTQAGALALLSKHSCVACHAMDSKLVGPSFKDVAAKHGTRADALAYLAGKIKSGGSGVWGQVPMPAQALGDEDAGLIARWLADGARR